MSTLPPAGWFDDPEQPGQLRYWDGERWTDARHVNPARGPQASPAGGKPDVAATLPGASWGSRAGALVLDFLVVIVSGVVVGLLTYAVVGDAAAWTDAEDGDFPVAVLVGLVAIGAGSFIYPWLWMGLDGGRTLGMRWVGIRVVGKDGQPIGVGRAALRELVIKGALGIFYLPIILSYLWPLWEKNQRALHDLMAETRVVRGDGVRAAVAQTDAFGNPVSTAT